MKFISTYILAFVLCQIASAQVEYLVETYEFANGPTGDLKAAEEVGFATEEFFITASTIYSQIKKPYITRYRKSDFGVDWQIELEHKWNASSSKFNLGSTHFDSSGTCHLIYRKHIKKEDKTEFFYQTISVTGETSELTAFASIQCENPGMFKFEWFNNQLAIAAITDISKEERTAAHAIWVDENYAVVGQQTAPAFWLGYYLDNIALDKADKAVYLITHKNTNTSPLQTRDMPYFLYKFDFKNDATRRVALNDRVDFELFNPHIFLNESNNELLITAMAGEKSTRNMNTNALFSVSKEDLSIAKKIFSPISEESIEKLQRSKKISEKIFKSSKAADFYISDPLFDKNNGFYLILVNRVGSGVYALHYNQDYQLIWQDYIIGPGGSQNYIKEDKLVLEGSVSPKFMDAVYGDIDQFKNTTNDHEGLARFTITPENQTIEVIALFNYELGVVSWFSLEQPIEINCENQFHLAFKFGSSYAMPKRQFFILKPTAD